MVCHRFHGKYLLSGDPVADPPMGVMGGGGVGSGVIYVKI